MSLAPVETPTVSVCVSSVHPLMRSDRRAEGMPGSTYTFSLRYRKEGCSLSVKCEGMQEVWGV